MDVVIDISSVSKQYHRYARPQDRLFELITGRARTVNTTALESVSLKVAAGETIGIIGRNGSGKSTLLQVIAGILQPTSGEVHIHGRVSALLELGGSFNPEFTGRDNVYFTARLYGLEEHAIESRFSDIERFAEIGEAIDAPVRTYSTGMFVRLAFAVAIHVDPTILIVDEALAVGDIFFQQKCFARINDLRAQGVTVLFATHDLSMIYRLCDRALVLEHGRVLIIGSPKEAVDFYEAHGIMLGDEQARQTPLVETHRDGMVDRSISSKGARVESVQVSTNDREAVQTVVSGESVRLSIRVVFDEDMEDPHVGFILRDRVGESLFETNTYTMNRRIGPVAAGTTGLFDFDFGLPLREGDYTFSIGVADGGYAHGLFRRQFVYAHSLASVSVVPDRNDIIWSGLVNLRPSCRTSLLLPRVDEVDRAGT